MSFAAGIFRGLAPILCVLSLGAAAAFGQAASNVKCKKCVDAGDLAKRAVVKRTIAKGAVTRKKIAPGAVDSARLVDGAVIGPKIGAGAVTGAKVRDGAISAAKIAPSAVSGDKIAPLAVTGPKLAPGAATGDKIADGAITGAKLAGGAVGAAAFAPSAVTPDAIADGSVDTNDLADDSVGTDQIAGAAVTTDALAGSISGAKFSPGAVTADKLVPELGGLKFTRTIVVGPTGTPAQNCTALIDALNGITDSRADNRYVIKLEPGIYDCGTTVVFMKFFVDIEGSGQNATVIQGNPDREVVRVIAELRNLRVEHSGGGSSATAINVNQGIGEPGKLTNVTAVAQGGAIQTRAVDTRGEVVLTNVQAIATGSDPTSGIAVGVFVDGSGLSPTVQLSNVEASATGAGLNVGLRADIGNTVIVRNSVFSAVTAFSADGGTANLLASQIDGAQVGDSQFNCVGAYSGGFMELSDTCD